MSWADRTDHAPAAFYVEPTYNRMRVQVLKAFFVKGERMEVGTHVVLIEPVARDLIARGRAKESA